MASRGCFLSETAVSSNLSLVNKVFALLKEKEPLFRKIEDDKPVYVFSRSDPRFANFIQRPNGRLGMVDWEDSGWHDPAYAAADLLLHPNQEDLLSWEAWQPFFTPYFAERRKIDPSIEQRFVWYTAVLPLFWLALFLKISVGKKQDGTFDNWQINHLPANQRIQNYLVWAAERFLVIG